MKGKLYLTVDQLEDGIILAIISDGHPQLKDKHVLVCSVKTFDGPLEKAKLLADEWFKRMLVEKPWETVGVINDMRYYR